MSEPTGEQQQEKAEQALVPRSAAREIRVVESSLPVLDTAKFEQMQRIATLMADMSLLPDHMVAKPYWWPKGQKSLAPADLKTWREQLGAEEWGRSWAEAKRRTAANCFLVVEQSFRWLMSPFAVVAETYEVGGKLGYQGKLVHAVVEARADLAEPLDFSWDGEGLDRAVTIAGRFRAKPDKPCSDRVVLRSVKTDNKMWTSDPDQKLLYTGVIHWARRFCPGVLLGISTVEDLERIDQEEREKNVMPRAPSTLDSFGNGAPVTPAPAAAGAGTVGGDAQAEPMPVSVGEEPVAQQEEEQTGDAADLGEQLSAEELAKLRATADAANVSWDQLEESFGGPLSQYSEEGLDADGLAFKVMQRIKTLAQRRGKKG
jgi:hypothetical protein